MILEENVEEEHWNELSEQRVLRWAETIDWFCCTCGHLLGNCHCFPTKRAMMAQDKGKQIEAI